MREATVVPINATTTTPTACRIDGRNWLMAASPAEHTHHILAVYEVKPRRTSARRQHNAHHPPACRLLAAPDRHPSARTVARIILLDDEARLLQTLAKFLENQGHQVVRGSRFAEIQEHVQPGQFEVLISDIVMPDFDGMKVLREVVQRRGCQEPVMLITGEPNLETASEAVRLGAFDYITKPVTKDKLLEATGRALRHVQLLRERDQARLTEMQVLQNLALLGESASILTHEIRTPVTSLRHALAAVGAKLGVEDRVLVEELIANLNKIERLLGQTLSFAKPLQLRRQPVDLAAAVDDGIRSVRTVPTMHAMQIESKCPEGLIVDADAQLLGEVFVNLLRNAGEACNGKGTVAVSARPDGKHVVVEVSDDGPGIPPERRADIWRPFHSTKEFGTGIGLAFSRKIVESHGGTIRLNERPGPGASFRIELPRHDMSQDLVEPTHHV
jgi:signal transduction histidine kinase